MQFHSIILEVSQDTNVRHFASYGREYLQLERDILDMMTKLRTEGETEMAIQHRAKGRRASYFSKNWTQLKSLAQALKHIDSSIQEIASIPVSAFKSDSGKTTITKGAGGDTLRKNMVKSMAAIGENQIVRDLIQVYKAQSRQPTRPRVPQREVNIDKEKTKGNAIRGEQQSQVEQLINSTIKQLPSHLQSQARQVVAKSGNKIKALQQFLSEVQ